MSRIAALTVILLAGALSALWAFTVPIFQAPDEPAHFDYAMQIHGAGRLIRLADGTRDWLVTPYSRYLMRATDFDRIVGHSSMRVPEGYGSRTYFARLDAGAPDPRARIAPSGRINYIAALYPFGFYALEALWMHPVAALTASLTATFFAARLLCVALTLIGLYFNYRTALNVGVPPWTAVALVAAIGFLPLTSLVSSYVQPDNLAYALVSASLFFATRLGRGVPRFGSFAALGLVLGALAVTKYQFFLSAALPIGIYALVRIVRERRGAAAKALAAAALAAPAVALLAVQHYVVNRSGAGAVTPTAIGTEPLRGALAAGVAPALHYVATTAFAGFIDFFVWGGCVATFWQTIGWVDTPIVIGNASVETWIRYAIALVTIVVAMILAARFGRNAMRLAAAATRGHGAAALRAATGDVVLNSYLCFLAIMLALFVVSNNAFGAEGRQWYPYVFVAFLCFVWYAPRALTRNYRAAGGVLACVLLAYSLTAAAYAYSDLRQRYYGPPGAGYAVVDPTPAEIAPQRLGMLWPVAAAAYHASSGDVRYAYRRGEALVVIGAAISANSTARPSAVAVELDGGTALPVLANQYAFMIAEAMHNVDDGYRAFDAKIATSQLAEGAHTIAAYARFADARRYAVIPPTRLFFITARDGAFSPEYLRVLQRVPVAPGTLEGAGACRSGVMLLRGRIGSANAASYAAVWVLVAGRPFPARYDSSDGAFTAVIPTRDLAAGTHSATAYAVMDGSARSSRIAQSVTLRIGSRELTREYRQCDDQIF